VPYTRTLLWELRVICARAMTPPCNVTIVGDEFFIDGRPTYEGVSWSGRRIQGLLFNARMVQAVFDDLNAETRWRWAYPDTGVWDAERNTTEFIAAMPFWRRHGLLAFTVNLQGGSPTGYSDEQPWHNSAIKADGTLREDYLLRLDRVLRRASQLGMVVILGVFYFGQERHLRDEGAIIRAVDETADWLLAGEYRNVLVEIANESGRGYQQAILQPDRIHELIHRVKARTRNGRRLLASTSCGGDAPSLLLPRAEVVAASDFLLLHGNNVDGPEELVDLIERARSIHSYRLMPVIVNEDDHFDFGKPSNHMVAATITYTSWGYFDYRRRGEGFEDGYQSMPVDWRINSARKRGFFTKLAEITGSNTAGGCA
jgi:hypothetical protein